MVADFYGGDFNNHSHQRHYTDRRKMFCLVARHYGYTFSEIQHFLDFKSHATIVCACKTMHNLMEVYPEFKRQFNIIINNLERKLHEQYIIVNE